MVGFRLGAARRRQLPGRCPAWHRRQGCCSSSPPARQLTRPATPAPARRQAARRRQASTSTGSAHADRQPGRRLRGGLRLRGHLLHAAAASGGLRDQAAPRSRDRRPGRDRRAARTRGIAGEPALGHRYAPGHGGLRQPVPPACRADAGRSARSPAPAPPGWPSARRCWTSRWCTRSRLTPPSSSSCFRRTPWTTPRTRSPPPSARCAWAARKAASCRSAPRRRSAASTA